MQGARSGDYLRPASPPGSLKDREPRVREAAERDFPWIHTALSEAGLPTRDVLPRMGSFLVADLDGIRVAAVGLEVHGRFALLRSLIVVPAARELGVGSELVRSVLALARGSGVHYVYLLTETASDFFSRFGFAAVDRSTAPPEVRSTAEFSELCSSTAILMSKDLHAQ